VNIVREYGLSDKCDLVKKMV